MYIFQNFKSYIIVYLQILQLAFSSFNFSMLEIKTSHFLKLVESRIGLEMDVYIQNRPKSHSHQYQLTLSFVSLAEFLEIKFMHVQQCLWLAFLICKIVHCVPKTLLFPDPSRVYF